MNEPVGNLPPITFGSVFAGIGGFDLGFERAGMKCVWQIEKDEHCQKILRKNFPNAELYGDIANVETSSLKPVDVICGGFPCQDISTAGLGGNMGRGGMDADRPDVARSRKGLGGSRSRLWFDYVRLVGEMSPRWVVIENVPSLRSSRGGHDLFTVIQGLVKCGYGVSWAVLNARYFGVATERRRMFIVGCLDEPRSAAEILFGRDGLREVLSEKQTKRNRFPMFVGWDGGLSLERLGQCLLTQVHPTGERGGNGISGRMDKIRYRQLGNAVVPHVAEWIGRRIVAMELGNPL